MFGFRQRADLGMVNGEGKFTLDKESSQLIPPTAYCCGFPSLRISPLTNGLNRRHLEQFFLSSASAKDEPAPYVTNSQNHLGNETTELHSHISVCICPNVRTSWRLIHWSVARTASMRMKRAVTAVGRTNCSPSPRGVPGVFFPSSCWVNAPAPPSIAVEMMKVLVGLVASSLSRNPEIHVWFYWGRKRNKMKNKIRGI